ncbi:MAG: CDP-glucose 4,6-dehydratase, partial [Tumebacillaceae bacterium]
GFALHPPTSPSLYEQADVEHGMNSIIGDVRDIESLRDALTRAQPEIIFHLAAQPLVRASYQDPIGTYSTNVLGTAHLLEAARSCSSVRAILNVTTDKVYENKEWSWGYRENEPLGGYDPYSSSKACSELVTSSYRESFFPPERYAEHGVAVATARAGNVIGGGDWAIDRLIPDCLSALQENKTILLRNPHAIRPWQHVLEPLHGYLLLAQKLVLEGSKYGQAYNFGPDDADSVPVEQVVRLLCEAWGEQARYHVEQTEQPHEAHFLKLDVSKAKHMLGWHPRWSLADALKRIVQWTHASRRGENVRETCLKQIRAYVAGSE